MPRTPQPRREPARISVIQRGILARAAGWHGNGVPYQEMQRRTNLRRAQLDRSTTDLVNKGFVRRNWRGNIIITEAGRRELRKPRIGHSAWW